MSQLIAGVFSNSDIAGKAVASLKEKGYTQHVSVVAKDNQGEVTSHPVKVDIGEGIVTGAVSGGAIGAVVGLISGALSIAIPGAFLLVAGPLAAAWGISGAVAGTLAGGLLGGLVKLGFPEEKAKAFEKYILAGDVLVTVEVDNDRQDSVVSILNSFQAREIAILPKAV